MGILRRRKGKHRGNEILAVRITNKSPTRLRLLLSSLSLAQPVRLPLFRLPLAVAAPPNPSPLAETLDPPPCAPPDGGGRGIPRGGPRGGALPLAAARGSGRRRAGRRRGRARVRGGAPRAYLQLQAGHHRAHHHRGPARRARRQGNRRRRLRPRRRGRSAALCSPPRGVTLVSLVLIRWPAL